MLQQPRDQYHRLTQRNCEETHPNWHILSDLSRTQAQTRGPRVHELGNRSLDEQKHSPKAKTKKR